LNSVLDNRGKDEQPIMDNITANENIIFILSP